MHANHRRLVPVLLSLIVGGLGLTASPSAATNGAADLPGAGQTRSRS